MLAYSRTSTQCTYLVLALSLLSLCSLSLSLSLSHTHTERETPCRSHPKSAHSGEVALVHTLVHTHLFHLLVHTHSTATPQGALDQTQARAEEFAQAAADSLAALPSSATRDALVLLCHKVISGTPIK